MHSTIFMPEWRTCTCVQVLSATGIGKPVCILKLATSLMFSLNHHDVVLAH
ncbi:MAG TPA: hypothetical protein PLO78_06380 [Candidatus Omnitrophota bacterium]|nr:hypothetical protein [Candidatus Omnitrophota bacterium]